jgi:hypothetical protein
VGSGLNVALSGAVNAVTCNAVIEKEGAARSYESYILELVWGRYALSELRLYEAAIARWRGEGSREILLEESLQLLT